MKTMEQESEALELSPNIFSGSLQLLFDNYVNQRSALKKGLPHEFLVYGIVGACFAIYFGLLYFASYSLPFYVLAVPLAAGFILQMIFLYGELKHRSYRVYEDHIEVEDRFFDRSSQTSRFENITDMNLEKPVVQRLFGTGNIRLNTAGSGNSEIVLRYLKNPDRYYEKLSELVNSRSYNQKLE